MKKRRIAISFTALFIVAAVLGTFAYNNSKSKEKETEYLSASWIYNFKDIEEISQASDLIALVRVDSIEDTEEDGGIPFTYFKVNVITPVYNSDSIESFVINMTGRETENKITEIIDDPLLQIGEEIMVFCKQNDDGTYHIISGPQGRLVCGNGKVNSLNSVNARVAEANPYSNIRVQNEDLDTLIKEIKEYVK